MNRASLAYRRTSTTQKLTRSRPQIGLSPFPRGTRPNEAPATSTVPPCDYTTWPDESEEPRAHTPTPPHTAKQDVRPSNKNSSGGSSEDGNGGVHNSGINCGGSSIRSSAVLLPHNPPPLVHRPARAHARRPRLAGPPPQVPDRLPPGRAAVRRHDHEGERAGPRRGGRAPPERRRAARREDARPRVLGREEGRRGRCPRVVVRGKKAAGGSVWSEEGSNETLMNGTGACALWVTPRALEGGGSLLLVGMCV